MLALLGNMATSLNLNQSISAIWCEDLSALFSRPLRCAYRLELVVSRIRTSLCNVLHQQ